MPITPMFHVHAWGFPWAATAAGVKQVYPGRYAPDVLLKLIKTEGVTFTHGVPTILQMLLAAAEQANVDLYGPDHGDRRFRPVQGPGPEGDGQGHRHLRRLRHVGDGAYPHRGASQKPPFDRRSRRRGGNPHAGRGSRFRWSMSASSIPR